MNRDLVSRERPILFSGPMVRAILSGAKTQTRRVVKPQPRFHAHDRPGWYPDGDSKRRMHYATLEHFRRGVPLDFCPYGEPGSKLWVRETWRQQGARHEPAYRADTVPETDGFVWRPSIFMPRWACRLVLEVTEASVERLQEISAADCYAEGGERPSPKAIGSDVCARDNARSWYRELWDSLNAKRGYGWDVDPWVWCISFRKCK